MDRKRPFSSVNDYKPPQNPVIAKAQEARQRAEKQRLNAKRNPKAKQAARHAVRAALSRGEITPKACEIRFPGCQNWPTEAHHESYEKGFELAVKWACKACHDKLSSQAWRESYWRKQLGDWPRVVCHLMGPQCAGKSYALRCAGIPGLHCWSVLSFYESQGAIERGENWPPKLRLMNPREWYRRTSGLQKELVKWLRQGGVDVRFIVSSGLNRRLNAYLVDAQIQGRFELENIYLDSGPDETLARAIQRGLDPYSVLHFRRRWGREIGPVIVMCHTMAVARLWEVATRFAT